MAKNPIFNLSYGVFMVSTKAGDKINGCTTNTCIQVANDPTRVAIAVLNRNYTCDLIKESGVFAVSIYDQTVTFQTISHFGHNTGREMDKFEGMELPTDINGVPYLNYQSNAVLSCKVLEQHELGTHTLFIGEVLEAKLLNDNKPLLYDDYQTKLKPKKKAPAEASSKKIIGWRCTICNFKYMGETLPSDYECEVCGHGPEDFEPIYED